MSICNSQTTYEPQHGKHQQNGLCAQQRLRLAWTEFSLYAQWVAKNPKIPHADGDDSDQTGECPGCSSLGAHVILLALSCPDMKMEPKSYATANRQNACAAIQRSHTALSMSYSSSIYFACDQEIRMRRFVCACAVRLI